jgi:hypothetical protein
MYDPHFYIPPYRTDVPRTPFPELDDPAFWEEIAASTGIPAAIYPTTYEIPQAAYQQRPIIVDGSLVPVAETSPPPMPTSIAPTLPPGKQKASDTWGIQMMLWGIIILLGGTLIGGFFTSQPHASSTVSPPASGYSLYGSPSISSDFIEQVLDFYQSPAKGTGQSLYDLGVQYGVDPVFALAFFMQESSFGKAGIAPLTHSLSNMRCSSAYPCYHDSINGDYAQFPDWRTGFEAWYLLITGPVYKGSGLTTIDTIVPKYAPSADKNDPQGYRCFLKYAIDTWRRKGKLEVDTPPASYCA